MQEQLGGNNFLLHTYTYDSNNNILSELIQGWKNDSWGNNALTTYAYNSENNAVTELWQKWKNNTWENYVQYWRSYDENGNGTSVEYWTWSGDSWQRSNNFTSGLKLYYNNMQSYFLGGDHKMTASYLKLSDLTSIAPPPKTPELNAITIYPNPTKGELRMENGQFRIENVKIFDIFGKQLLILNSSFSILNSIDISHLPAGTYFVQIMTEKGVVTKKVLKL